MKRRSLLLLLLLAIGAPWGVWAQTYQQVTSNLSDWCGTYLLVGGSEDYAFSGVNSDSQGSATSVSVSSSSISSPGSAAVLTISHYSENSSYYTIQINNGNYLYSAYDGFRTGSSATNGTYTDGDGNTQNYYCYFSISYSGGNILIYCPHWSDNGNPYYIKYRHYRTGFIIYTHHRYFIETTNTDSDYSYPRLFKIPTPANATCATATTLNCGTSNLSGTTVGTPGHSHNISGASISNYGVWYTFPGNGASTTITVAPASGYDTKIVVAYGSCDNLTYVGYNDSGSSGSNDSYSFTPEAGKRYYVYVAYYGSSGTSSNTGSFSISRSCGTVPDITMQCGVTYEGFLGTSGNWDGPYSSCTYTEPGEENIYLYTPPGSGSYTFTTTTVSGDPDFFLMSSRGTSGTNLTGGCWGSGNKTVTLTGGTTYYLIVDNYSSSNNAEYKVSVSCPSFPLTYSASPSAGGSVSVTNNSSNVTSGSNIAYGTVLDITATPANGYFFTGWTVTGNGASVADPNSATTTFTMGSEAATLTANFAQPSYIIDFETAALDQFGFVNDGSYPWVITDCSNSSSSVTPYAGSYCMMSGNYNVASTESAMQMTVEFISQGSIVFNWLSSGEGSTYDYGRFYVNGTQVASTNVASWSQYTYNVAAAGTYTFKWAYRKDSSVNNADDRLYVDNITLFGNGNFVAVIPDPTAGGTATVGSNGAQGIFVANGGSTALTATPASNYHFVNWTESNSTLSSVNPYTLSNITANHVVKANFSNTSTLTTSVNPNGGGTITCNPSSSNGVYNDGTQVQLTATPNTGYQFSGWTVDGSSVGITNPYTITMNGDHNVVANFTLNSYSVQVSANPSAGGTVSGGGTYNHGASCTVTATVDACYDFDGWYENNALVSSSTSYSFNVTSARTLEARFTIQTYTVTTAGTGGTVTGGGTYNCGATANIEAIPDACHTFSHFVDDNGAPLYGFNPLPMGVDHDMTITAIFSTITYAINASASPAAGGTVSGANTYNCGDNCTLTATPATDYVFDNWTENGNVVSSNATYSFTVSAARTLVANFHQDAVSITATAYDDSNNTTGGGSITGTGSITIGGTCTLVATPNTGYEFVRWTENGTEVSTNATYSFTVSVARTLEAHFRLIDYTLTLVADPTAGGTVSASPAGPYHHGDAVTISATVNAGYTFGSWSDGGAQSHQVTINSDTTFTAYFGADHTLTTYVNPIEGGYVTIAPVSNINAVTVGTGTTGSTYVPFSTAAEYSFVETLYTSADLGSAGTITSISYELNGSQSSSNNEIEVYMVHTQKTSFSSKSDFIAVTANDKVFEGTWNIPGSGWATIVLDKPFQYNGTDNLMIGINEKSSGTSARSFNQETVDNSRVTCYGSVVIDPTVSGFYNGTGLDYSKGNQRANVRLGFGTYHHGTIVELTAHPNTGYYFYNWTDGNDNVYSANPLTDTLTSNVSYTAHFIDHKIFAYDGNWNNGGNWIPAGAPTLSENVSIEADATITASYSGTDYVATANNIIINGGSITIQDGGQLQHNNNGVNLTAEKYIIGYTLDSAQTNWNYYLFSSPVDNIAANNVTGLQASSSGHHDLYKFVSNNVEGSELLEWVAVGNGNLKLKEGYIYANRDTTTLAITGTVQPSNDTIMKMLAYNSGYRFGGWNLIGNPFVCNAYVNIANYYVLNHQTNYDEFVATDNTHAIAPLSGLMVVASASGQSVTYSRTAFSNAKTGILNIDVRTMERGSAMLDRARLRFGEGEGLEKFQFNPNHTKVYIPDGDKDFAVYYAEGAGTIPVNFKAENNGRYTLDFSTEDVGFNYIHLIDNMNGNDVDLLKTPYYSFDARSTDYASRFTIVFATGDSNDGNFAFYNNGLWIINNDGEATLQVVDALGRILSSETISGSCSKAINAAPGVYMLRLINGNNVKVQKIVVRR